MFETLFVLVENHGRVVTKNVLMETLWPDVFVEESSLTQNISLLRKALGNGQADQVYVETIPKRGYRFVAPVTEVKSECPTSFSLSADPDKTLSFDFAKLKLVGPASPAPGKLAPLELPASRGARRWLSWQSLAVLFCLVAVSAGMLFWWRLRTATRHPGFALKSVAVLPFKTVGGDGDTDLLALGMANSVILN